MAEVGKEYSFDITKTYEIFDRLLKDEQLKLEDGHVLSSAEEVMGKKYFFRVMLKHLKGGGP